MMLVSSLSLGSLETVGDTSFSIGEAGHDSARLAYRVLTVFFGCPVGVILGGSATLLALSVRNIREFRRAGYYRPLISLAVLGVGCTVMLAVFSHLLGVEKIHAPIVLVSVIGGVALGCLLGRGILADGKASREGELLLSSNPPKLLS